MYRLSKPVLQTSVLLAICLGQVNGSQESIIVRVSEIALRRATINIVMPSYPEEAINQKANGIAVVELLTDGEGNVDKINILEAPHPTIRKALVAAVKQWKFKPSTANGMSVRYSGKLTFYFVIDDKGIATVRNPRVVGS